jgi:hypothetical protein
VLERQTVHLHLLRGAAAGDLDRHHRPADLRGHLPTRVLRAGRRCSRRDCCPRPSSPRCWRRPTRRPLRCGGGWLGWGCSWRPCRPSPTSAG